MRYSLPTGCYPGLADPHKAKKSLHRNLRCRLRLGRSAPDRMELRRPSAVLARLAEEQPALRRHLGPLGSNL